MKVLSIIETIEMSHGGPPEVLKNQISQINKKEKIIDTLLLKNISFYYLIKILFIRKHRLKFYDFLNNYDLMHFHTLWSLKVFFLAYFANKTLVKFFFVGHGYIDLWSINEQYIKKKLFIYFFLQYAYSSASCSFFSTVDEYLEAKKSLKIHNPFIIPNGVNLNLFKARKIKKKIKKKILFFGRIHKKKGLDILIDVVSKLPPYFFDDFSFHITGPGKKKHIDYFKNKINQKSLQNKIKIYGAISSKNKIQYLKKFDIFILPSFEEGDSIALKEALASYLPVIITKQCRMNIVKDYNAGIIIESNNNSLYKALLKIRKANIILMANNARKLVEEKFDNRICSMRLLKVYQDIMCCAHKSRDWYFDEEK